MLGNLLITASISFGYAAAQLAALVILARLGSAELVGQYGLALAVTAPVFMFLYFRLRYVAATDQSSEYADTDYLGHRVVSMVVAVLVTGIVCTVADFSAEVTLVTMAVAISRAFEGVSDVCHGILQRREDFKHIAISYWMAGAALVLSIPAGLTLFDSLAVGLLIYALLRAIIAIGVDRRNAGLSTKFSTASFSGLSGLVRLALPLAMVSLLTSLAMNIPRYSVAAFLDDERLGIFIALGYVPVAGMMFANAVGHAYLPQLSRAIRDHEQRRYANLLLSMFLIVAVACVIAAVLAEFFGSEFLRIVFGNIYAEYNRVFVLLIVAAAIAYVTGLVVQILTALRVLWAQVVLLSLQAGLVGFGCLVAVNIDELRDVAEVMLIAELLVLPIAVCLLLYFSIRKNTMPGGHGE